MIMTTGNRKNNSKEIKNMLTEEISYKVKCCAKITISMKSYRNIPEAVLYWNGGFTPTQLINWMWYFEYLAAVIKIHYPERKVTLTTGRQDMPVGQEYIDIKSKSLLSGKRGQLKKILNTPFEDDLFGFTGEKRQSKIDKLVKEIKELEVGQFNYWVPPAHINRIREYIRKSDKYAVRNQLEQRL